MNFVGVSVVAADGRFRYNLSPLYFKNIAYMQLMPSIMTSALLKTTCDCVWGKHKWKQSRGNLSYLLFAISSIISICICWISASFPIVEGEYDPIFNGWPVFLFRLLSLHCNPVRPASDLWLLVDFDSSWWDEHTELNLRIRYLGKQNAVK